MSEPIARSVDLSTLAFDVLEVSIPTVKLMMRRHVDFPILKRGGQGRAWQFDADAVLAFVASLRARRDADLAARERLVTDIQAGHAIPARSACSAATITEIFETLAAELEGHVAELAGRLDAREALAACLGPALARAKNQIFEALKTSATGGRDA